MGLGSLRRHAAVRAAAAPAPAASPSWALPTHGMVTVDAAKEYAREMLREAEATIAELRAASSPAEVRDVDAEIEAIKTAHAAEIAELRAMHEREIESLTAPADGGKKKKG